MEDFYESWVETVFRIVARQSGCVLKTGRKRETVRPIVWEPAYAGSQKSLVPDLWMERDGLTVIVDAKYKRHWEELKESSWRDFETEMREQHRADLMQSLAYANLSKTDRTITCLAYPCSQENWKVMLERRRIIHKASISGGDKHLELWLIAVPMSVGAREVAAVMSEAINAAASV
jgi:5-methylcytosine-specific restriction endonuclease McrBC regulatory subunit McrC